MNTGAPTTTESDTSELVAVLSSLADDMADMNSDFEGRLSMWDGTDNDPADPEQADLDDIYDYGQTL